MSPQQEASGVLAWMARNSVPANLLMIVLAVGGLLMGLGVKQEVFPEFDLDIVQVQVPYPGASPAEVEQGIVLAVEESVRGVDGVKRVTSTAVEGMGSVVIELMMGANANKALQDVKSAIDRITSFPDESERPVVSLQTHRSDVISLVIHGNLDERVLRELAERARDELLQHPSITQVELSGIRPLEISIEIPQARLRAYDQTLDEIARRVSRAAVELPGGGVKTASGEVLLRTAERRDLGREFADVTVVSDAAGTDVKLGEIAEIRDGFADTDERALFNGEKAVRIQVYRVGDQTPKEVAAAVKAFADKFQRSLPEGVGVSTWMDRSELLADRLSLLLRNASLGLVLVLLTLGAFLQPNLAGWVTLGIPISVLGGFLVMPALDVSINMISLFAFILTLGIIVDDAIVVGENIYEERRRGTPALAAAIRGVQGVVVPVTFSVATNIVAFIPLLIVPGVMGKLFRVIPLVVIPVLLFSLVESLFVLPCHLAHVRRPKRRRLSTTVLRWQEHFSRGLERFVERHYEPRVRIALEYPQLTAAIGVGVLILTIGYVGSGRINFSFMPKVDSDLVVARVVLPFGTPIERTEEVERRLLEGARTVLDRHGGAAIVRGIYTQIGGTTAGFRHVSALGPSGSHLANVQVYLCPSDHRPVTASAFAAQWQKEIGPMAGLESLTFDYSTGPSAGNAIDIELTHPRPDILERAAAELARALEGFTGVFSIDDGVVLGKPQLDFRIQPEGRSLGITAASLGQQLRNSFYGAEAIRQQRGRNEVKVMVRLPEAERRSEYDVEELVLQAPDGADVPLMVAAQVKRGRAYTEIKRANGQRVVDVTADVIPGVANAGKVLAALRTDVLPDLMKRYPGLRYGLEGEQRDQRESMRNLGIGFVMSLLAMYALIAIPFRSYAQPLIVLIAIPFGMVGAVLGHLIMGFELSMMSMMGIVALSGVVVNDSLVLVHTANRLTEGGVDAFDAIVAACVRRFRPILLTSLTTFFGLLPMVFEPSMQARFLIPMALSLGYGVLFATVIVLVLVPALYLMLERHRNPQPS